MKQKTPPAKKKSFIAVIEKPDDDMDTAYVSIPFSVAEVYGTKGQVKVKVWFDEHPYRGSLANMGTGCHVIIVRKDVREAIAKQVGDRVKVELEEDTEERIVEIPQDLKLALSKKPKAKAFFDSLSFTNRKEYVSWITSARKTETREKRLPAVIQKLLSGKKNPAQK